MSSNMPHYVTPFLQEMGLCHEGSTPMADKDTIWVQNGPGIVQGYYLSPNMGLTH